MSSSRIVVTGIGATTPIGGTAPDSWSALLAGESGARSLEHDWVAKYELPVTFAASARVPAETVLARPEAKRLDPSSQYALVAAREAWADAGTPEVEPERLGVDFATGIGGLWTLLDGWDTLREKGPRRVMPMSVPMLMPNAPAAAISMHLEARAYARTVASACASSTESIVNAVEHIRLGLADVVIAGGMESMSNIPYYMLEGRKGYGFGHGKVVDGMIHDGLWDPYDDQHMGMCAEACADKPVLCVRMRDAL